jgi:hypothetical protein
MNEGVRLRTVSLSLEERPMFASEPKKSPFSADAIGETDFARVDAHVIQAEEYEELPEPTDAMMERADRYDGTT